MPNPIVQVRGVSKSYCRAARESPCCPDDRTSTHREPGRSDWAYAPLLHGDFGAATQAGADAVDDLNAGMQSLTDGHRRPNLPTDDDRHLHHAATLHDENHAAAVSLDHRRARDHADRLSVDRHPRRARQRSEEHTSELQSQFHLVCRLLLEKKNTT